MFKPTPHEVTLLRYLSGKTWVRWTKVYDHAAPMNVIERTQQHVRSWFERLERCGYVHHTDSDRMMPDQDFYLLTHAGAKLLMRIDSE